MKHMKYLETKIDPSTKESELQLCIQCDLDTFEWLMKYIHSDLTNQRVTYSCREPGNDTTDSDSYKHREGELELNLQNIIKLLIPAEFLKIETLRNECINFIGQNIEAITKMKINMNFLQQETFAKLATKIDTEVLDTLRERKDKFITKLFDRKLQQLL